MLAGSCIVIAGRLNHIKLYHCLVTLILKINFQTINLFLNYWDFLLQKSKVAKNV